MRILIVTYSIAWKANFLRCYHPARQMVKEGHSVTLVTTSATRRRGIVCSEEAGVEIIEAPSVLWGGPRSGFDPWNVWQRNRALRGRKYDVIHAFEGRPASIYPALQAVRENPQALFVMDWADWWGRGGSIRERSGRLFEHTLGHLETYYEEGFRLRAHAATVVSEALAVRLAGLGFPAERIHRLPPGCDHQRLQAIAPEEARAELPSLPAGPLIGYLGALMPPDAVLLEHAFELLRQRMPVTLLLIGNHRLPANHILLRTPDVVVTGSLSYPEMNRSLCACDALVLPHRDNVSNRGRWPSKMNDYLCVARPIVATAMGEVAKLLRPHDAGILVRDDAEALAGGLVQALTDRALANRIAANALGVAKTVLPWEQVTRELLDFYAEQKDGKSAAPAGLPPAEIGSRERELVTH